MTMKTADSAGVLVTQRATPTSVRYLLGGVLINQLGAFVQTFIVLYLIVKGFSAGQAGVTLAAYSVGAAAGTLLGGELTHRFGTRTTIVAAMATSATILGLVPLLSDPALFGFPLVVVATTGLATQSTVAFSPAGPVLAVGVRNRVLLFNVSKPSDSHLLGTISGSSHLVGFCVHAVTGCVGVVVTVCGQWGRVVREAV